MATKLQTFWLDNLMPTKTAEIKKANTKIEYAIPETSSNSLSLQQRNKNAEQRVYDFYFLTSLNLSKPSNPQILSPYGETSEDYFAEDMKRRIYENMYGKGSYKNLKGKSLEPTEDSYEASIRQQLLNIRTKLVDQMLADYMMDLRFCVSAELRHVWDGKLSHPESIIENLRNRFSSKKSNLEQIKHLQWVAQSLSKKKDNQEELEYVKKAIDTLSVNSWTDEDLKKLIDRHVNSSNWVSKKGEQWDYAKMKEWRKSELEKMIDIMKSPSPEEWNEIIRKMDVFVSGPSPISSLPERFSDCSSDRKIAYSRFIDSGFKDEELAALAVYFFIFGSWGSSYGGPNWASVSKAYYMIAEASKEDKYGLGEFQKIHAVDLVHGLQHNNGNALNKVNLYAVNDYNPEVLNFKAEAKTPLAYIPHISKSLLPAKKFVELNYSDFTGEIEQQELSAIDQIISDFNFGKLKTSFGISGYSTLKNLESKGDTKTICDLLTNKPFEPEDVMILSSLLINKRFSDSSLVCLAENQNLNRASRTILFEGLNKASSTPIAGHALSVFLEKQKLDQEKNEYMDTEFEYLMKNVNRRFMPYLVKNPSIPPYILPLILEDTFSAIDELKKDQDEIKEKHKAQEIEYAEYKKNIHPEWDMEEEINLINEKYENFQTPFFKEQVYINRKIVKSIGENPLIKMNVPELLGVEEIINNAEFPEIDSEYTKKTSNENEIKKIIKEIEDAAKEYGLNMVGPKTQIFQEEVGEYTKEYQFSIPPVISAAVLYEDKETAEVNRYLSKKEDVPISNLIPYIKNTFDSSIYGLAKNKKSIFSTILNSVKDDELFSVVPILDSKAVLRYKEDENAKFIITLLFDFNENTINLEFSSKNKNIVHKVDYHPGLPTEKLISELTLKLRESIIKSIPVGLNDDIWTTIGTMISTFPEVSSFKKIGENQYKFHSDITFPVFKEMHYYIFKDKAQILNKETQKTEQLPSKDIGKCVEKIISFIKGTKFSITSTIKEPEPTPAAPTLDPWAVPLKQKEKPKQQIPEDSNIGLIVATLSKLPGTTTNQKTDPAGNYAIFANNSDKNLNIEVKYLAAAKQYIVDNMMEVAKSFKNVQDVIQYLDKFIAQFN